MRVPVLSPTRPSSLTSTAAVFGPVYVKRARQSWSDPNSRRIVGTGLDLFRSRRPASRATYYRCGLVVEAARFGSGKSENALGPCRPGGSQLKRGGRRQWSPYPCRPGRRAVVRKTSVRGSKTFWDFPAADVTNPCRMAPSYQMPV